MYKLLIIIITFILLTSCNEKPFQIESKFDNGNPEIIYLPLSDTTIHGKNDNSKFKIEFNKQNNTLRKALYITKIALVEHLF